MPLTNIPVNRGLNSGPFLRCTCLFAAFSLAALMAGCTVPKHMRIENAYHPKYEDEDVRFRATYYFRVFDYCADQVKSNQQPQSDTLYRFRMTGKAHSLTTQVHFESGTLTAGQIDPFGANVVYDERNNQFYLKSQSQGQVEAQREGRMQDLRRMVGEYRGLMDAMDLKAADMKEKDKELLDEFRSVLKQQIAALNEPGNPSGTDKEKAAKEAAKEGAKSEGNQNGSGSCLQTRRGFQILGPEGWRTFNQDERLLLAMAIRGKPLISTMQELSGRVLNNQPIEAEMLLPLVQEDLRISLAERDLEKFSGTNPERGKDLLQSAIDKLSKGGQK